MLLAQSCCINDSASGPCMERVKEGGRKSERGIEGGGRERDVIE